MLVRAFLLALAVCAGALPTTTAHANRGRLAAGVGAATARHPHPALTKVRSQARTQAQTHARTTREVERGQDRGFFARNFGMRPQVSARVDAARTAAANGQFARAQRLVTRAGLSAGGLRERLAIGSAQRGLNRAQERARATSLRRIVTAARGRAQRGELTRSALHVARATMNATSRSERRMVASAARTVRRSTMRALRQRSRAGDAIGTSDALNSLDVLRQSGQMGWFTRFRAWWASRRAVARTLRASRWNARRGNLEAAYENLLLVAERDGGDSRRVRRGFSNLYKRSMAHAKRAARYGDTHGASAALQMASQVMPDGGEARLERDAQWIMRRAAERGLPKLAKEAARLYHRGEHQQAAMLLADAQFLQESTGVVPSRRVRRSLESTAALLGPRMQAPRAHALQAAPTAAASGGPTAVDLIRGRGRQ